MFAVSPNKKTLHVGRSNGQSFWGIRRVCRQSPPADLLHKRQKVCDSPMIGDLSVLYAHHVHSFKLDFAVARRDSVERAFVSPVIRFKGDYAIAVSKLPVDFGAKVRKCSPHARVKVAHAGLIRSGSGLCRVVDKIICKQFLEYFELPLVLNFLSVSANGGFAGRAVAHCHSPISDWIDGSASRLRAPAPKATI